MSLSRLKKRIEKVEEILHERRGGEDILFSDGPVTAERLEELKKEYERMGKGYILFIDDIPD
ncbi:hypothetical protein PFZ59_02840 [Streptococcus suis]|uniref:hypothetical protein n=1 Tax=Streptococcus suis TaxID=1307 RepID=UPI00240DEA78|nr:hypothetical protein [Streptococcus suis]WFA76413.1 hypothetical protein PFZ59_02840 [Streptococcus suis]